MNAEGPSEAVNDTPQPHWCPLTARQRRVLGVLIEKAKTTPDAYPMTLNALTNGCNQKSNRSPQMDLSSEAVADTLDELRQLGAVTEVQGSGRVAKYKHLLYSWLGVDKAEIAVMAELLLRGEQTVGELRARASRMERIADLAALQPILVSLGEKNLLVFLTPEGRGQVVTHALYSPEELARLRAQHGDLASEPESGPTIPGKAATTAPPPAGPSVTHDMFIELELEVNELRAEVARLRDELRQIREALA